MNSKKVFVLFGLAIVMMATTHIVFAQEATVSSIDPVAITSDPQFTSAKESDMQWAWGEVTNLDNQTKTVTLKYLDYEADQEKELVLVVDEKTTFENIKDFNELKLKDTLSIDYVIEADNKNIAKNVSFEKPDVSSSVIAPAIENSEPVISSSSGLPVVEVVEPAVLPETAASELVQPAAQLETPVDSSIAANGSPAVEPSLAPVEPVLAVQDQAR